MKIIKIIAAFCCLFSVFNNSVAQENVVPDGRKWVMREFNVSPTNDIDNIITCIVNGDTVLQGYAYKKVYFTKNDDAASTDISMLIRRDGSKIYQRYGSYGKWNPDTLVFDEDWVVGDTIPLFIAEGLCANIADTGELQGRKFWNVSGLYTWLQDVGYIETRMFFDAYQPLLGSNICSLICCIDPGNDTLYVNRDLLPLLQTGIKDISTDNVSFTQQGERCIVTLPYDAATWSATLYNSVGAVVARRSGEGSEIVLPATSKGTHILVVNADGRVVKKKVFIK